MSRSHELNVKEIIQLAQKAEESKAHRKGTFKIEAPFDKALDSILKSKPHLMPKKQGRK